MNGEQAFERQLARWLEEGPNAAPVEPVAAALAHVRTHPDQRRAPVGAWRRIVSGIELTHIPSQPRRGLLAGLAAVAVVVVAVAAYGLFNLGGQGGAGGGPTPTPAITPTPTATRAPVSPRPTATLGPGVATGTQSCGPYTGDVVTTVNAVIETRGGVMECTNVSTDPRFTGEARITLNIDEHADGLGYVWGTFELSNAGGRWTGPYSFTTSAKALAMESSQVWTGSGGYEGLEALARVHVVTPDQTSFTVRVFEPGAPISGTETCSVAGGGTEIVVGDVTASRGVRLSCTDRMSDPRVSGTRGIAVSIDTRKDESAALWGTATLTNAAGGWEGFFFGTVDPGYTTHRVTSLMHGTGAYEGLLFRLDVVGSGEPGYNLTGEIIPDFVP